MTDADDEMFAGMIAEALNPIAREVTTPANEGRHFAPVTPLNPKHVARFHELKDNSRTKSALCPCGSGQFGYNLFNPRRELVLYCCFACEKPRRTQLKSVAES